MPRLSASRTLSAFALALFVTAGSARAQLQWDPGQTPTMPSGGSGTWTSLATTNWSDGTNDVAWNSLIAVFGNTAGTVAIDAANPVSATGLTFNTDGYTVNNGTLTLTGAGTITTAAGATGTTISSAVLGSVGLTKAGAGTLILGGANNFSGTVAVNAGTLSIAADAALGAAANAVSLGTSASAGGLSYTGATASIARAIALGTLAGSATGNTVNVATSGTTLTLSGRITGGPANATGNTALTVTGPGTLVLGNNVVTAGSDNTFTGNIVVDGGGLQVVGLNGGTGEGVMFGGGTKSITLTNGGRLVAVTTNLNFTSGTKSVVVGAGGGTINTNGVNISLDDPNQFSGTGDLTKVGASTLVIGGQANAMTYTGANVNVLAGTLQLQNKAALGVTTGKTVNLNGGSLFLKDDGTGNNVSVAFGYNVALVTGTTTIDVNRNAANSGNTIVLGTVAGLGAGNGTLTVTGANNYSLATGAATLAGDPMLNTAAGVTFASLNGGGASRTFTKTGAGFVAATGAGTNFGAGPSVVNASAGAVIAGTATSYGPSVTVTLTNAFTEYAQNESATTGSTYNLPSTGIIGGDGPFLNSLTTTGGNPNINLIPATVAETVAGVLGGASPTAAAFLATLPNDASRFLAIAGAITGETVTLGTGTPFAGLSNDNVLLRSFAGTVVANSDIGIRATNNVTFALNTVTLTPAVPRTVTVSGGVVTFNSGTSNYNANVTLAVASGATLQPTVANAFGTNTAAGGAGNNAAVSILNGGAFNPNAVAVNANVTIQVGGVLNIDDAANLTGTGTYTQFAGSITRITNNGSTALSASTASPGTVAGSTVRLTTDDIRNLGNGVAGATSPAANYVVNYANATAVNGVNFEQYATATNLTLNSGGPVVVTGTTLPIPTGVLTNDGANRVLAPSSTSTTTATSGTITILGGGGTLAASTGFTFTIQGNPTASAVSGISIAAGPNTLNVGLPAGSGTIDGLAKAGTVGISGPVGTSVVAGAVNVYSGTLSNLSGGITYTVGGGTGVTRVYSGAALSSATNTLFNSTLQLDAGSSGRFTQTTPAVAGLQGAGNIVLGAATATTAGVALTVGGNNLSTTYAGVVSQNITSPGVGSLTKAGTGTLTLTGANTYTGPTTISAGTLSIGDGGTTGSVSATGGIADNATLVFNRSDATSYAGIISGTGSLTKLGGGVTTLTGANTYTGATNVNAGQLTVSGTGSLSTSTALSIAGGARFNYLPTTNGALTVATVNLADNSTFATTFGSSLASIGAAATTTATTVYLVPSGAFTSGQAYPLLTGGTGSSLDAANYIVLNPTNFTYTVAKTPTSVAVTPTTAATPATLYWKGGYANNVFTASNGNATAGQAQSNFTTDAAGTAFSPVTPGATTTVNFSASNAAGQSAITLGTSASVLALVVLATETNAVVIGPDVNNTLTLAQATAGSNALLINAGGASLTVGSNVTAGGSQTWTNSSTTGSVLTVGSAGTAVTLGANTVVVAGTGATTIAGNLSGATGVLTKTATGNLTLGGTTNALLTLNLNAAGVFDIGAANLTVSNAGGNTIQSSITTGTAFINATGGGKIVLNVNNTNGPDNGVANGGTLQFNAQVTGTSTFEFSRSGVTTGVIYLANNANDFTGGVVINQGVIRTDTVGVTGAASGLGTGANIYLNNNAAGLRYTGTGETSNKVINFFGTAGGGVVEQAGTGALVVTGNVASGGGVARVLTLAGSTAGTGEIAGVIGQNSATFTTALLKTGTGTWTLSGANTYSGATTINDNGGYLVVANSAALGTSTVTIGSGGGNAAGGTLRLANNVAVAGTPAVNFAQSRSLPTAGGVANLENLSGANSLSANLNINGAGGSGANILSTAGTLTLSGTLQNTVASTNRPFTFYGAGNTTVTGTIQDGTGTAPLTGVNKLDVGTLTFSGATANTYTGGTTVSAGTLVASKTAGSSTGTAAVAVNGTGTLGGTGTVGGFVTVSAAGTVRGDSGTGTGTLTTPGGVSVASTAFLAANLAAGGPSGVASKLALGAGTLSFVSGTTVALTGVTGFDPAVGGIYVLATTDAGTINVGGSQAANNVPFATYTVGNPTPNSGPVNLTIPAGTYQTGDTFSLSRVDNNLQLNFTPSTVPEPVTVGLVGVAGLGLLRAVRRRRAKAAM